MIEIPDEAYETYDYDDWLEFFRKVRPVQDLLQAQAQLKQTLSPEGYAAAARWIEIISNPSKMDKLYQGRLKAQTNKDIMDVAVGDDDEEFYMALIRENVQQLNTSNATQQEVARLTQNINIFRKELREIRSRKPKKGTILEKVLAKANEIEKSEPAPKKRPSRTASKGVSKAKTVKVSSKKKTAVTGANKGQIKEKAKSNGEKTADRQPNSKN